jgi:transcriptional regulator with XRE-family HTH domain
MARTNGGAAAPARICPGCRKTRLSRYNPGSLCGACARAVQSPPGPAGAGYAGEGWAPAWTWDSPLLRDALARADLGGAVAIIRAAAGMTQLQFADMLGWSQATVWRIEASERKSLYDIRELLRFADAIGMPRGALIPLLLSSPEGQPAGAGWPYPAAPATGEQARGSSHSQSSQLAKVSYLRACALRLQEQDQAGGGARIRDHALHTWNAARRMLDEVTSPGKAGDDLASATGQLAICAGWACYDSGDPATARRLYAEALVLSQQAGDGALAAEAMVTASLLLADGDRPGMAGQALALAERAAAQARREPSPRLHALMDARQALAHARLGDSAAFRAAITRAWRETDRGDPGDQPAWLDFARPAEIAVHEAKGLVSLGDPRGAASLVRDALQDEGISPRNRVMYRAHLATALAVSGDTDDAMEHAATVLVQLEGPVLSPRARTALSPVRAAAGRAGATGFCTRFDACGQLPSSQTPAFRAARSG